MNPTSRPITIKKGVKNPKRALEIALTHAEKYSDRDTISYKPTEAQKQGGDDQTLKSEIAKNGQIYVGCVVVVEG